MRLSRICIERPVFSIVMSLIIVVLGGISLVRLPNREFPNVDPPVVSVVTRLLGAAPEVVETSVTQVLEEEIMGIEGIKHVTSESREEVSLISVQFELSHDLNAAAADIRDRVSQARLSLPDDVKEPIVSKASADAVEIVWFNLSGGGLNQIELSTLAETRLKDRLAKLPGVARVYTAGERRHSIRLWIDHERLTARGLAISDVENALRRGNIDIPSGRIEGVDQEFTVRTLGELKTAEQFGALIIANRGGNLVRLRDIGRAEAGAEDNRSIIRIDGEVGVGLGIIKQSKANTLEVARAVREEAEAIQRELPAGVTIEAVWDVSIFIERSVRDVTMTIVYAVVLVLIVIFVFLRSVRATIIPAVAIPISIVGCFLFLYILDFSINTLTLMAFTLAIGLVVDDSIVVLENVSRWLEEGVPRLEATRRAVDEIAFAVIAASISVMAVFLPLAFLTDEIGRLFREFGIAVAAAVAISAFVALTLTPTLCARILRKPGEARGFEATLRDGVDRLRAGYARGLDRSIQHPMIALAIAGAWIGLGLFLLANIDREFIPDADRASILTFIQAPEGSTLEYTDRYQREVEEILHNTPGARSSFSMVGLEFGTPPIVNQGVIFTLLDPWEDRGPAQSQQQMVEELNGTLAKIPGVYVNVINEPMIWTSFQEAPVSLVIQGPDYRQMARYADEIVRRAQEIPGFRRVNSNLKLNKPQLNVWIDREKASDLGVSVREIGTTLQILLGGLDLSTFKLHGETYKVIAQLERPNRSNPADLYDLYVRSNSGRLVSLDSLVTVEQTVSPPVLSHYDRMRAASIGANLTKGTALGSALEQIRAVAEDVLPRSGGYRMAFTGNSERFYQSSNALLFAYAFSLVLIYLVLAAQFESFIDPATILVSAILSFTGALLALTATQGLYRLGLTSAHGTLNLFSGIGLVMLVGLVTKNAILIVEFANQLRDRGATARDAVLAAARTRFRPVLMTALSTIAGIMPIALGWGAGGEARAPLGIAVVGGLAFSTLLTFFMVPAVYLGFSHLEQRIHQRSPAPVIPPTTLPTAAGPGTEDPYASVIDSR